MPPMNPLAYRTLDIHPRGPFDFGGEGIDETGQTFREALDFRKNHSMFHFAHLTLCSKIVPL
jgi:hypothetical protein